MHSGYYMVKKKSCYNNHFMSLTKILRLFYVHVVRARITNESFFRTVDLSFSTFNIDWSISKLYLYIHMFLFTVDLSRSVSDRKNHNYCPFFFFFGWTQLLSLSIKRWEYVAIILHFFVVKIYRNAMILLEYWLTIHLKKVSMRKRKKVINILTTFFYFS